MVEIIKQQNSFKVVFTLDDFYLYTGDIVLPFNSLTLVVDESDMATFRRSATNDLLFSCPIDELEIASTQATKQNIKTLFNDNCCSTGAVDAYTKEEADSIFLKILTAGEGIDIEEDNDATLIIGGLRYVSWSNIKDLDKDGKYITVTPIMSNTDYDFNLDGVTDYRDLMVLADYILGKPVTKPEGMTDEEWRDWLDVNLDNKVNVGDITALITIIRNDTGAKKAIVIFQFTDGTITELDRFEAGNGTGNGLYLKDVNGNIKQNTDSNDYSGSDNVYITPAPIIISTELANSNTILMGKDAHASGNNQIAIGQGTHTNYPSEVSIGRYNKIIGYQKFSVGDGTGDNGNLRHNLFYVDSDGSFYIVDCDKIGQSDGLGGTYTYETAPYIKIQDAVADSKVFLVNFRQNGPIGWTADLTYADTLAAVADGKLVVFSYVNVTTTEYGIAYHLGSLNKFQADIIELDNNVASLTLDSNDTALLAVNKTLATTDSNNLTNYYTKTDSYNKTEVDNLIAGAGGGAYTVDSNNNVKLATDTNTYTGRNNTFLVSKVNDSLITSVNKSVVIGYNGRAGTDSVAIGDLAICDNDYSIAIGKLVYTGNTSGGKCTTIGYMTDAYNLGEVSLGMNNKSVSSGTDDLLTQFSVGDGSRPSTAHNLFWVAKDGSFYIIDSDKIGESDGQGGTYDKYTAPYLRVQDAFNAGGGGLYEKDSNGNIKQNTDTNVYTGINNIFLNKPGSGLSLTASNAVVIGENCFTKNNSSNAIGYNSRALGNHSTAIGYQSSTAALDCLAIGSNNSCLSSYYGCTAIGNYATTNGQQAISIGSSTVANSSLSTAIGVNTSSLNTKEVSLGAYNVCLQGNTGDLITQFSVGDGEDSSKRHNLFWVANDGSFNIVDTAKVGQSDGNGGTYTYYTAPYMNIQQTIGDIDTVLSNIVGV